MLCEAQILPETITRDTIVPDRCRFLVSRMEQYYSLVLLLTASEANAEECFTLAVDTWLKSSLNLPPMIEEVADISIRRALVDCALRICIPVVGGVRAKSKLDAPPRKLPHTWPPRLAAIAQLGTFERFVFVLSVLESYSDIECSDLLHCSPEEIAECRVQALYSVATALRN